MRWQRIDLTTRVSRSLSIEWNMIEDKAVLVNIEDGIVLKLDDIGTAVWTAMEGPSTIGSLVSSICDVYDVDRKTALEDMMCLLNRLKSSEAIEFTNEGGNRRWSFFRNVFQGLRR